MPDTPPPGATPTGFQRTSGGGVRWHPPTPEELGRLLPQYEIECLLGRGGMGAVYKGVQRVLDRPVAIKILPPDLDDAEGNYAERFKNEARTMAKMDHPAIVAVHDFGETSERQLYFVMAFVDGTDVARMIREQGRLPAEHALAVTAHVCDALTYAHARGVVHRDIKPANILINYEGQVKVADFGLAKASEAGAIGLTKTGLAMGTPDFVAPEALVFGANLDGRADLYAVGVMLYQMLTGVVPRGAWKLASVVAPSLDRRFDDIIDRAMQVDPSDRYQSAEELRRDLDVILTTPILQERGESSVAIPKQVLLASQARRAPAKKATTAAPVKVVTPEPASKLPWVIGIAAVAVLGVVGVVLMGKRGGEEKVVTPVPVAALPVPSSTTAKAGRADGPSSAANVPATSNDVNAAASPKAALGGPSALPSPVSASPAPPVSSAPSVSSSPDPEFPPGKWVKMFTKFEDLPAELREPKSKRSAKWNNGWIEAARAGVQLNLAVPSTLSGNYALRARFRKGGGNHHGIVLRRQAGDEAGLYQLKVTENTLTCQRREGDRYHLVSSGRLDSGDEFTLEFAALGSRFYGRQDSRLLCVGTDATYPAGDAGFYVNDMAIRDIEVINLDGLPEAEALKLLGVDEKGNDLRQPAAVSSSPPVSSSPSPPVSSATAQFPPGQWVKVFTKFEDLPADLRKPESGVRWEDGWIRFTPGLTPRIPIVSGLRNCGIRAKIERLSDNPKNRCTFILRSDGTDTSEYYRLYYANQLLVSSKRVKNDSPYIFQMPLSGPPNDEGEYLMEFAVTGSRLIGRFGSNAVRVARGADLSGDIAYITGEEPLRDIEVINLDGLPEAEALRLLGVDEQGNDLRALAAKEAEAQSAAAKEAATIAAIPELKELHAQFEKLRAERVEAVFAAELAKLNTGYFGGLDRTIADEKKAGHLDGVLALEAEKKAIAAGQPLPADEESTLGALKKLRQIYRDSLAKLETQRVANLKALTDPLGVRLKQLESSLTQQNRIDDAKFVRGYRERLEQGEAGAPADNDDKAKEAGKGARAPAKEFPPGDDRKAAEWVISVGGSVTVLSGRDSLRAIRNEDLPKGSFEIQTVDIDKEKAGNAAMAFNDLAMLSGLRKLEAIGINRLGVSDADIDVLASLPSLRRLTVSNSPAFSGVGLDRLNDVTYLSLGGSAIGPEGIKSIGALSNLEYLRLSSCKVSDSDVAELSGLEKLTGLALTKTDVTLAGWRRFKGKPLVNIGFSIPAEGGETWCRELASLFPEVRQVEVNIEDGPHIADVTASLGAFRDLVEVSFASPDCDNATFEGFSRIENLSTLTLRASGRGSPKLTDAGINHLLRLKLLTKLHLDDADGITPAALTTLAEHKSLKTLGVINCAQITPAAIEAFQKARPDVTVVR